MTVQPFHRRQADMLPERAAPVTTVGIVGWLRVNLFSSWINTAFTIIALYLLWLIIPGLIDWVFISSDISGDDRFACNSPGACWAWLDQRIDQFLYGFYTPDQTWRVNIAVVLLVPALAPLLFKGVPLAR